MKDSKGTAMKSRDTNGGGTTSGMGANSESKKTQARPRPTPAFELTSNEKIFCASELAEKISASSSFYAPSKDRLISDAR